MSTPLNKPDTEVVLHTPTRQVIVRAIATHGNDLLLLPSEYSKYHNTLIMLDSQSDRFCRFILPESLKESWSFAVTEDALWFNSPGHEGTLFFSPPLPALGGILDGSMLPAPSQMIELQFLRAVFRTERCHVAHSSHSRTAISRPARPALVG